MTSRPSEDGILPLDVGVESPIDEADQDEIPNEDIHAPSISLSTPRMWFLSIFFSIFGSSINLFFSLRYPSVSISPIIALLLAHPLGHLWDFVFSSRPDDPVYSSIPINSEEDILNSPVRDLSRQNSSQSRKSTYSSFRAWKSWLGQGRFSEKEHACIYIASNVTFATSFSMDVIVEQSKFYNQEVSIVYQILLTLSTQILGYAFAGITRRFLVQPAAMVWPGTLVAKAMFSSLHKNENKPAGSWRISPFKFFSYVSVISAVWYIVPGFLMPALSYFNVLTWFAPENVLLANVFGVTSGLGLFPLTFDWSQIAYIGSPLVVPFWAALNVIGGLVIVMWVLAPIMYYTNSLYTAHMPILSSAAFDNTGQVYNVTRILTPGFVFDQAAYEDYSRVFLPATYVLSYALQFAALPALIVHTVCFHGRDTWRQVKKSFFQVKVRARKERQSRLESSTLSTQTSNISDSSFAPTPDLDGFLDESELRMIHDQIENDVPDWWYVATGLAMTATGILVVEG
jgi:OPT family small oligopeptide transporter